MPHESRPLRSWLISDVRQKMHRSLAISLTCLGLAGCVGVRVRKVSDAHLAESERTGICCVHQVSMKRSVTAVRYGFIVVPQGSGGDIERAHFPFAQRHVYGGHRLGPPWSAEIFVCGECTAAKEAWIRRHPHDYWSDWWKRDIEEPNKAPEPTTLLVTPRAGARVAPSRVVAHL